MNITQTGTITLSVEDIISLPDGRLVYLIPGPRGYPGVDGIQGERGKSSPVIIQYLAVFKLHERKVSYTIGELFTTANIAHNIVVCDEDDRLCVFLDISCAVGKIQVLAELKDEMLTIASHGQKHINLQCIKQLLTEAESIRCYITFIIPSS